jgi:hypothetical protein
MQGMKERSPTFADFWPRYLREHGRPQTRAIHYAGTGLALALLAAAAWTGDLRLIAAAVVAGYLFAWIAHAFVERNRPATFTHPWWSLVSDFRMFGLWTIGRLGRHLRDAGVK